MLNKTRKRILIAEDLDEERALLKMLLREQAFDVDFASNGEEAVMLVDASCERGEEYDYILLDIAMPKLSGLGTARKILEHRREDECKPRIKFLTNQSKSDEGIMISVAALGLDPIEDVVEKNAVIDHLIEYICGLLELTVESEEEE